jgi:uncharacterized membrane protein
MKSILTFALLTALAAPLSAHEGKHAAEAAKTAVKSAESAVVSAAKDAPGAIKEGAAAAQKLDFIAIMKAASTNHIHNKIVHFPIALGLVGVLFSLLAYKFPSFMSSSRWLLFLAGLASVAAILSGRAQKDSIEGVMARQVMEAHEMQGYFAFGWLWLNWAMSFWTSQRKWSWILLLLLSVVLLFTGTLGGALAHMQF